MKAAPAILMLAALAIASFAMFGVAAMSHGGTHAGWCPVAAPVGDCPNTLNALTAVSFHLDGLQGFLTATVKDASSGSLFTFLAFLALWFAFSQPAFAERAKNILRSLPRPTCEPLSHRKTHLIRWLAFHENSPAFT